jgi:hypothetical protein
MITLLFNHRSPILYVVEALGILGLIAVGWRMVAKGFGWIGWLLFVIVVAIYLFIRFCTSVRWYRDAKRYEGIELQFKKAMSPTVYVMFIGSVFFQIFPSVIELAILVFMLLVISHVNVILLCLHYRDKQDLPVNYFSNNKAVL